LNQALLIRLFKSIEGDAKSPTIRIAHNIVEEERKKGHIILADKLSAILSEKLESHKNDFPTFKLIKDGTFKVPVDRRYRLPLAIHVEHDQLRHHMILSEMIDSKIRRIEKEYLARERLGLHGLKPRKKILLYGSSGCGKSMAAERIAWDLGLPFYRVRFDTIISSYLGESASNLQSLFESINDFPCVLLLDEFDIIGKKRDPSGRDVGEIHRIVNVLLGLLEEYDGEGIIIATTNLEESIDKAMFRRFDDFIEFSKPTEDEIFQLLTMTFSALTLEKNIQLRQLAKKMTGLSYAIASKIATDAAKNSILNMNTEIRRSDLEKSIQDNTTLNK
jgi:SpoVK/Ycf46/Vps4 family AAA+-type ATPase